MHWGTTKTENPFQDLSVFSAVKPIWLSLRHGLRLVFQDIEAWHMHVHRGTWHTHTHTDTFPTSSNPILSGYLGTTETNWDGSIGGWSTGRHKKHEGCFVSERLRKQHSTRRLDLSEHNLNVQNVQNEDKCSAFFQDQVATQGPWWSQHWFGEHLFIYRWQYLLHFT